MKSSNYAESTVTYVVQCFCHVFVLNPIWGFSLAQSWHVAKLNIVKCKRLSAKFTSMQRTCQLSFCRNVLAMLYFFVVVFISTLFNTVFASWSKTFWIISECKGGAPPEAHVQCHFFNFCKINFNSLISLTISFLTYLFQLHFFFLESRGCSKKKQ